MALSRAVLRSNVIGGEDPADSIGRANRLITRDSRSGLFVTLFYAVLDAGGHTLTYVNAGHNPPVLLRGQEINMLDRSGIALGAVEETDYAETAVSLENGDAIVFYTDGVTEANNASGEMFGEQRLVNTIRANGGLPAGELMEKIKSEVIAFSNGVPQADDITMIVLKVL
jgi:sigma-B regulation protein RsbU (phosphoserine phosphatase)